MLRTILVAASSAAIFFTSIAQAQTGETPRRQSVLGPAALGEVRFRASEQQLKSIGIPGISDFAEAGLVYERQPGRVAGILRTALGDLAFSSTQEGEAVVRVEFGLPGEGGTLAYVVDRANLVAEASYPENMAITYVDRFVLRMLPLAMARYISNETLEADVLLRASRMWGEHPLSRIRIKQVAASKERDWTDICGTEWTWLGHDAWNHSFIWEWRNVGPWAVDCHGRCGPGCDAWWGTSAWTVDCGEHDRCVHHDGANYGPDCGDEWNSASDDFSFAPNCHLEGW